MNASQSIFKIPTTVGEWQQLSPFATFHGSFEIGAESDESRAYIRQREKESISVSPPDHFYVFDVALKDVAKSKWMSFVHSVDITEVGGQFQVTTLVSLKSSIPGTYKAIFRVVSKDNVRTDFSMGEIHVPEEETFVQETLSTWCEVSGEVDRAKLIIFIPSREEVNFTISMLNVFVTNWSQAGK